jgi:hypothetical protein
MRRRTLPHRLMVFRKLPEDTRLHHRDLRQAKGDTATLLRMHRLRSTGTPRLRRPRRTPTVTQSARTSGPM